MNAMLDLVKQETGHIDNRFLEPVCDDGNFLAEILRQKLGVVKSHYGKNAYLNIQRNDERQEEYVPGGFTRYMFGLEGEAGSVYGDKIGVRGKGK